MHESTTTTRSLDDRLDSAAEAWKPKPGDKLIGVVVDVDSRTNEYGTYPIVTLRDDNGDEWAVHGFHTVLKNELTKRQPRLGERLGIKYLGESDKGYKAYRVVWEDVAPPDWDRIAVEAEADAGIVDHEPTVDERPSFDTDDTATPFDDV